MTLQPPTDTMSTSERFITLADGRTLCYAEHGEPTGRPVLWLHGAASSRLEAMFFDDGARARGLRIISTDRPGCGGSSPRPGYTFLSYSSDLLELQDALGIEACAVGGFSNGGAFSLAAGHRYPDRFPAVIAVNATSPIADRAVRAVLPKITKLAYRNLRLTPDFVLQRRLVQPPAPRSPPAEPTSPAEAEMRAFTELFAAATAQARRQPTSGYIQRDVRLGYRRWGFDHRSLTQPVEIVTGDQDAGYEYARVLATELADARLTTFEGGHVSIAVDPGASAILDALARAALVNA